MKKCNRCGKRRPPSEFSKNVARSDGLDSWCKVCRHKERREYRAANLEKLRQYEVRYAGSHREEKLASARKYRQSNLEKCRKASREDMRRRRASDPEKFREIKRKYDEVHREELNMRAREKRKANPEKFREIDRKHRLRKEYGISIADYEDLLVKQNRHCAACGAEPFSVRAGGLLHVDHDHFTGKVRGLLCQACNLALGLLCDDIKIIGGLTRYLNAHQPK